AVVAPVSRGTRRPPLNRETAARQLCVARRYPATGRENSDIGWRFHRGEVVKLRVDNARAVLHGMQHPIHLHGQRFLVLAVNGTPNDNLAWKDTVLVPSGATVDLLLDLSNPGRCMLHCNISDLLEDGLMSTSPVDCS